MTEQTKTTLCPVVGQLLAGDPIGHANLTLVPLRGERHGQLDYDLATEAIQAGALTITEVSEGGSVPELLATNTGDRMILLLDGEELVGAKQNRILNTSVLLPARSTTKIPVSCVEQGRWRHVSAAFACGNYSPAGLRARKSRDVSRNLQSAGEARSDQGAVWDEVADRSVALAAPSPTMAMHDVVEQRRESLNAYVEALGCPAGACGVIAAIDGRLAAVDLFDKVQTMAHVWPQLVTGYALDAIVSLQMVGKRPKRLRSFTAKGAAALLEHLGEIECQAFSSVGIGEDWRFEATDVLGQALVAESECVHLCVFPNELRGRQQDPGSSIMPPSSRRRARRNTPPDERVY